MSCCTRTWCRQVKKVTIIIFYLYIELNSAAIIAPASTTEVSRSILDFTSVTKKKIDSDYDIDELLKELEVIEKDNLETMTHKIKNEDLYKDSSKKDNINERSYIYIHGSRFRVPLLSPLLRSHNQQMAHIFDRNNYKTFVSNEDPNDYKNEFNTNVKVKAKESLKRTKIPVSVHVPPNPYQEAQVKDLNKEMQMVSNKVNNANRNIGMQYNEYRKWAPIVVERNEYSDDEHDTRVRKFEKLKRIHINNPGYSKVDNPTNIRHSNMRPNPVRISYQHNAEDMPEKKSSGVKVSDGLSAFVELLKTPIVRSEPSTNSKQYIPNTKYGNRNINVNHRIASDMQTQNGGNEKNNYSSENTEEPDFRDVRLVKTLEEMKQLNSIFIEEPPSNSKKTQFSSNADRIMIGQKIKNKNCLFPNCKYGKKTHDKYTSYKCNCDSIDRNSSDSDSYATKRSFKSFSDF